MCFYSQIDGVPVHINADGPLDDETMDAINRMVRVAYNYKWMKDKLKQHNMNFGQAIESLKAGKSVQRQGWNGKGMFLWLNKGSVHGHFDKTNPENVPADGTIEGINSNLFELGDVGTITRLPNINMRSATGSTVTGWLASQTDMLAEDWNEV